MNNLNTFQIVYKECRIGENEILLQFYPLKLPQSPFWFKIITIWQYQEISENENFYPGGKRLVIETH